MNCRQVSCPAFVRLLIPFVSLVRLFNQGLDIVEVSDDGCGVPIESRPFMATKHATSKIRDFSDIYSTDSLGFRGEALFCLANISANLVVATRTADEALGQKLEFTRDGYLRNETVSPVPRKIGTTVAVVKLFDALPVRRADLEKRLQVQRRDVFLMMQGCEYKMLRACVFRLWIKHAHPTLSTLYSSRCDTFTWGQIQCFRYL